MEIRPFALSDEKAVVDLWFRCDLVRPWNDPAKDIRRKLKVQAELFLVAVDGSGADGAHEDARTVSGGALVGTVMVGYEGHRGWVNYLAVDPGYRRAGLGRLLMECVEAKFREMGCPKINLQIRSDNTEVIAFYRATGYREDQVLSFGKRLEPDEA